MATETFYLITNHVLDFHALRKNMMLDLVSVKIGSGIKTYEKLLIYMNTIINHCIWKERNDIKFKIREDLMTNTLQTVWIEIINK